MEGDFSLVISTQAAMSETLASQAATLADISSTLTRISVAQARTEERLIGILEDNQRFEASMSDLGGRVRTLETLTSINKFALNFYPQVIIIISGTLVFGFCAGLGIMELMEKFSKASG